MQRGQFAQALQVCEQALLNDPDDAKLLTLAADLHARFGNAAMTRTLVARAETAFSKSVPYRQLECLGNAMFRIGRVAEAEALYQRALNVAGKHLSGARFNLAAVRRAQGLLEEAETLYDQVLRAVPQDYEAQRNRSELRRQTEARNHVPELRRLLARNPPVDGAIRLGFALGKELEDLGRYDEAFAAYRQANQRKRQHIRYRVETDIEILRALADSTPPFSDDALDDASTQAAPIFVVGLPRTGTTLVERILASHPQVTSIGESLAFPQAMRRAASACRLPAQDSPAARIAAYSELPADALADAYYGERQRLHEAPRDCAIRTLDKLPLNYLHVALIRRAMPAATIVLLERDPMDTAVALYRTLFRDPYPFTYDLDDIGRYLRAYYALMVRWHSRLPGLYRVSYEALVQNPRSEIDALLTACRLSRHPACYSPDRLNSPSTTASAAQIREPMHDRSVGQWRRYAVQLAPVQAVLQEGGPAFDVRVNKQQSG